MKDNQEKEIFIVYEVGLLLKAIQAFIEIVIAILLYFINTNSMVNSILAILHEELTENPNSILYNYFIQNTHQITISGKYFLLFYLLSHGVIKLVIITGLFLRKKWAYPASIIGFGGLILYQIYHLVLNNSPVLLILTIMDIAILWLIWHEHKVKNI
jgi:uncharacterized membrane protein